MKLYELTFEKEISDMSDEEMAEMLAEFKDKHAKNIESFNELKAEFDDVKEQLDGRISRLASDIAEKQTLLTEDELLNYSLERLEQMADTLDLEEEEEEEEADELDAEEDSPEEDESDDAEFMKEDKPSRAGDFDADDADEVREQAKARLSGLAGIVID